MKDISKNEISLDDLTVGYQKQGKNSVSVFGPVSLHISPGDMVCVIGRNGIGKSTLLRTIARLQTQLNGCVLFNGQDSRLLSKSDLAKKISFVSTEIIMVQNLLVHEMVNLGRFPYTNWIGKLTETDKQIVDDAIEKAGIFHLRNKFMHELSDGERQKVMIARALAQDTPVIVLDEPTAFLDLPSRYEMIRLLNKLTLIKNKTIIFSTHDLNIAMQEADKLWLMAGKKIVEGAPEDLIIRKEFHNLFQDSAIEYDSKIAGFSLSREFNGVVNLEGEGELLLWTKKALERKGFKNSQKAKLKINVAQANDKPEWKLYFDDEQAKFYSVYDLLNHIKKINQSIQYNHE